MISLMTTSCRHVLDRDCGVCIAIQSYHRLGFQFSFAKSKAEFAPSSLAPPPRAMDLVDLVYRRCTVVLGRYRPSVEGSSRALTKEWW